MASRAKRKSFVYKDQRSTTKDDVDLGARIRMRRVQLDLSQQDLAQTLRITFQQLQKYETGTNRVSASRLLELCYVLKVDPNYLLGWQGKPLNLDDAQARDSATLRMAKDINLLPPKLRAPVQALIRNVGELSAADLKRSIRSD